LNAVTDDDTEDDTQSGYGDEEGTTELPNGKSFQQQPRLFSPTFNSPSSIPIDNNNKTSAISINLNNNKFNNSARNSTRIKKYRLI
jgi:hypothetical protein